MKKQYRYEISNPSFVAQEYWKDDEPYPGDEIRQAFGNDSFHITKNIWFVHGDDGCEILEPETCEECLDRISCGDDYNDDFDTAVRVAEAVAHAVELAKHFSAKFSAKPEIEMVEKVVQCRRHCTGEYAQHTYRPKVRRKGGRSLGHHGSCSSSHDRREIRPIAAIFSCGRQVRIR